MYLIIFEHSEFTLMNSPTKSKGRPKTEDVASRHEALLDVATDVFLEFGFHCAKVSEIVKRANASKSSIYSRYPTKEDLFNAVIERKISILDENFIEIGSLHLSLDKILKKFALTLYETMFTEELRALFETVVAENRRIPELAHNFWQKGPQHAITVLAACLKNHPEFTGKDAQLAAETFVSMCLGASLLKTQLNSDYKLSKPEINKKIKEVTRVFLSAYC